MPFSDQRTRAAIQQIMQLAGSAARTWFVVDALGSVRQSLDDRGVPQAVASYDPWGVAQDDPIGLLGFAGEWQQGSQVYLRARWYDAAHGTFTSRDPYAGRPEQPYSQHPYQYAYSAPTTWTDPSGRYAIGDSDRDTATDDHVAPCPDGTFDVSFLYADKRPHCAPIIVPLMEFDPQVVFTYQTPVPQVKPIIDPFGIVVVVACENDNNEEESSSSFSSNVPPPNVPPEAPDKLRRAVEKYQRKLYSQRTDPLTGLTLKRPKSASVAVNRYTGNVVWTAHSAKYDPNFEADLIEQFGTSRTVGEWTQCAESRGCYIDAQGKATVDLDIFTWDIKTGKPIERCDNCRVSVNLPGQRIYSDPPFPSNKPRDLRGM